MKVVIIEDEINAREALTNLLNLIDPKIKILGHADNVDDAVNLIGKIKPEVVFLDIHIKNGSGFNVLEKLTNFNGKVVFTTAHENYAIKAFKFSAFDYILKPISPSQLKHIITKLNKELKKEYKFNKLLSVYKYNKDNTQEPKIVLKTLNNQHIVLISDIIRCKSEGAYTQFYFKDKTILTSKNLKYYDEFLVESDFIRTHQSHLINAIYISKISTNGFVVLKNEELIPVSARKKSYVYKRIRELI